MNKGYEAYLLLKLESIVDNNTGYSLIKIFHRIAVIHYYIIAFLFSLPGHRPLLMLARRHNLEKSSDKWTIYAYKCTMFVSQLIYSNKLLNYQVFIITYLKNIKGRNQLLLFHLQSVWLS